MLMVCKLCLAVISESDFQQHCRNKKHRTMQELDEWVQRSIAISPIPKKISTDELLYHLSKYGEIQYCVHTGNSVILIYIDPWPPAEYYKREVRIKNEIIKIGTGLKHLYPAIWTVYKDPKTTAVQSVRLVESFRYNEKIKYAILQESSFDSQLDKFLNAVQLTKEEFEQQYSPVSKTLATKFEHIFPRCKLYEFGSTQQQMALKGCDLDIFMDIGQEIHTNSEKNSGLTKGRILKKIDRTLRPYRSLVRGIRCVPKAKLVPPIMELQKNCEPEIIDGWQVNHNGCFPDEKYRTDNDIPQLLHDFFLFYSKFNFSKVICPIDSIAYPVHKFSNIKEMPASMKRYVDYVSLHGDQSKMKISPIINVQDPINLNANVTTGLSKRWLNFFRQHCQSAENICAIIPKYNLLDALLFSTKKSMLSIEKVIVVKRKKSEFFVWPTAVALSQMSLKPIGITCWGTLAISALIEALKHMFLANIECCNGRDEASTCLTCTSQWSQEQYNSICSMPEGSLNELAEVGRPTVEQIKDNNTKMINLDFSCYCMKEKFPHRLLVKFRNNATDEKVFANLLNAANYKLADYVEAIIEDRLLNTPKSESNTKLTDLH